jgi:hypothetical protein
MADEQQPGTGIDRTLIRDLLKLTPEQRIKQLASDSRGLLLQTLDTYNVRFILIGDVRCASLGIARGPSRHRDLLRPRC